MTWETASKEHHTVAVAFLIGEADSFCLSGRGGDAMFVTWELLLLFAGFIVSLLAYLDNHNKKN